MVGGKRRIHQRPELRHVAACHPWFDAVQPRVVVTTHPSAVLRLRGKDGYDEAFAALVDDLRLAAPYV